MDPRLEEASRNGDIAALHQLLQENTLLLDRLTAAPYSTDNPLHIAALLGHEEFAAEILRRKPELARDINGQGLSPLHFASASGHLTVVKGLLKEVGPNLCLVRDKDGTTPLHSAAIKGRAGVLGDLIEACPDSIRAVTCRGDTALHLAVKSSCFDVVKLLVEKMEDDHGLLNSKNDKGNTILHLAVARKQLQSTKFLASKSGVDVNCVNLKGFTPLDALLESPSEHGDLELGETIRAAGGKTAGEYINVQPPPAKSESIPRDHTPVVPPSSSSNSAASRLRRLFRLPRGARKTKDKLNKENDYTSKSNTLMLVATLIATITFQAGLNPPGGFEQDEGAQLFPGQAVLRDELHYFLFFDMVGLFASLSIILLLICVVPRRKRMATRMLVWVMWLAAFSTALAFTAAVFQIFPDSYLLIIIFLIGWYSILAIATIWLSIRFSIYLFQKVRWLKKNGRDGEGNKVKMGVALIVKRVAAVFVVVVVAILVSGVSFVIIARL